MSDLYSFPKFAFDWMISHGVIFGLFLTFFGAILVSLGNAIQKLSTEESSRQKYSHYQISMKEHFTTRIKNPIWIAGGAVELFGAAIHLVALEFAPAAILAPANSSAMIANAIVSTYLFGEQFENSQTLSIIVLAVGISVCALSCNSDVGLLSQGDLSPHLQSWSDVSYLSFLFFNFGIIISISFLIYFRRRQIRNDENNYFDEIFKTSNSILMPLGQNLESSPRQEIELCSSIRSFRRFNLSSLFDFKNIFFKNNNNNNSSFSSLNQLSSDSKTGMLCGCLSGSIGAHFVLEFKELLTVINVYQSQKYLPVHPAHLVGVLSTLILSGTCQLILLNVGMTYGKTSDVIPPFYFFWTLFGSLGGFAKFKEHRSMSLLQVISFAVGIILTLIASIYQSICPVSDYSTIDLQEESSSEVFHEPETPSSSGIEMKQNSNLLTFIRDTGFRLVPTRARGIYELNV